jgi:hypothetical protein
MLRRFVSKYCPLAVLVVLIVAILGMSRYAERRKANHQSDTQPCSPQTSIPPNNAAKGTQKTDKPKDAPSWIETFTWPEGVTAWALLLTLVIITWQSVETRAAAQGAFLNAQAVIDSERAWMIPKITQPDETEFMQAVTMEDGFLIPIEIVFTNLGTTPAIARRGLMEITSESIVDRSSNTAPTLILGLAVPPKYENSADYYVPGAFYVSEEKTPSYGGVPKALIVAEKPEWDSGKKCLCVKGFIEYIDTFGRLRISRYCYAYQNVTGIRALRNRLAGHPNRTWEFRKAGPDAYNEIT